MRSLVFCTAVLMASTGHLMGQTGATTPPVPADGGTTEVLQSIFIPPLPDAPFTLTLATEWVRPLGTDGNTVTLVNHRKIARDHAGRIFEERRYVAPAPGLPDSVSLTWLQIANPATHTYLNCSARTHVCHVLPDNSPVSRPNLESGTTKFAGGTQTQRNLGKDILDGVEVEGMQVTTVIDAGQFGNAKPVTIERTFWYSPELGINLKSTRNDPNSGRQTFTVTEISRDEPDPALWQVPAGFAVVDDRQPAKP